MPAIAAGHSLGEYSALVAAGSLDFVDAVSLVAQRARLMQQAVPQGQGGIAAVLGMEDAQLVAICERISIELAPMLVSAVNFNSPGQVVVAGHRQAVERAIEEAKAAGARRAVALPMSVPVHCDLMRPAAQGLAPTLDATPFRAPRFPVLHNADLAQHASPDEIRLALCSQLFTPVRWSATVRELKQRGAQRVIECGPGKVLTGLARRIERDLPCVCVSDPASLDAELDIVGVMS
jgi:[acyl-carrier-protein] S-malonyltransferase